MNFEKQPGGSLIFKVVQSCIRIKNLKMLNLNHIIIVNSTATNIKTFY